MDTTLDRVPCEKITKQLTIEVTDCFLQLYLQNKPCEALYQFLLRLLVRGFVGNTFECVNQQLVRILTLFLFSNRKSWFVHELFKVDFESKFLSSFLTSDVQKVEFEAQITSKNKTVQLQQLIGLFLVCDKQNQQFKSDLIPDHEYVQLKDNNFQQYIQYYSKIIDPKAVF